MLAIHTMKSHIFMEKQMEVQYAPTNVDYEALQTK